MTRWLLLLTLLLTALPLTHSTASSSRFGFFNRYYANNDSSKSRLNEEWEKVKTDLEKMVPDQKSLISEKLKQIREIQNNPSGVTFYEPSYLLPYYYSNSITPWYANHPNTTPENQTVSPTEAKAQLSFIFPLWSDMFNTPWMLSFAYTQLSYWQVYANSPYFRETNYEPQALFTYTGVRNWLFSFGFDHQSNGRGGVGYDGMERSWNRVFFHISFSGQHWFINVMPWIPVFKSSSSDLHNPNITHYLGYGRIVMAYASHNQEVSLKIRNALESGFKRGSLELNYTFPLYGKLKGIVTVFSGYGQSLIEYDHYSNSFGLGVAFNNWM